MRRLLLKLLRRRQLERDLRDEMAFHRELAAAAGNPVPFGNQVSLAEQARDLWRFTFFENLWRDLVYGLRGLRRRPGVTASALLSLALGIGANTAIFSLAVELLLSEPSVTDASSLAYVRLGANSHADRRALAAMTASGLFDGVAGENEETTINWNNGDETRPVFAVATTKNFFSVLGVPVARGRGILPGDPDEVVVLSDRFWRTHYQADETLIGRAINLDGKPYTVVGVLTRTHRTLIGFGLSPDVYVPAFAPDGALAMYARLKPGSSLAQAAAAVGVLGARLDREAPHDFIKYENGTVSPIAGFSRLVSEEQALIVGVFFLALLVIVGLVLLIACINVAGLLTAQALVREREFSVRLTLGAGRARLLQQLLAESLLLATIGTAAGFLVASGLGVVLSRVAVDLPIPIRVTIAPDWRVVAYAALLAAGCTVACGLVPAWYAVRDSIARGLQRERKLYLRRTLVIVQVAVSVIVLTVAVLFARNLFAARSIDPGFDVEHTIRATVNLSPSRYADASTIDDYRHRALVALRAVPGIEAAAAARIVPFNGAITRGMDITLTGTGEKKHITTNWNAVTPEYFSAMSIDLVDGPGFDGAPGASPRQVVINRTFADRFLPGVSPVGLTMTGMSGDGASEIVGVVEGTKNLTIGELPQPQLYGLAALRAVEPTAGLSVGTMQSSLGLAFLPSQVGAVLMGAVGGLGLLLVAIGLFGTVAYSVSRRTREIGVRIAVGATRGSVLRLVLNDSLRLLAIGGSIGFAVAWFAIKPLAAFLVPTIASTDASTFAVVFAVMTLTAVAATWSPARRAARIDPIITLKSE
jgi:predicted permease